MLLIYTHKITPRLKYIFKHIFTRIIGIPFEFTKEVGAFVAHNGMKMSYTKTPLSTEFFVKSNPLLFEQGVNDVELSFSRWKGLPCFFSTSSNSAIPFDLFAASFYLISRYEEYLPQVKDQHERFEAKESIAYKEGFLKKPLVDIWAYAFEEILKEQFPEFISKKRKYHYICSVDIDIAFEYKHKSFIRISGAFMKDLYQLQLKKIWDRFLVLFNIKEDPFDTYSLFLMEHNKKEFDLIFFFLVGNYTAFDKNISIGNNKFKALIKHLGDYAILGLHPSYYTKDNFEKLKKEKIKLEQVINTPITRSRQHYLRLALPSTYQNLTEIGIEEEFSMGYATEVGFRASTCTPFYFYDLDFEIQTPLKIFPFAYMDATLNDYKKLKPKHAKRQILELYEEVKAVNGTFISLMHNESLSENERWSGWRNMFLEAIRECKK